MKLQSKIKIQKVQNANDFVGIKFDSNIIEISVPASFREEADKKSLKKDLLLFLKSIEIAKTINYKDINTKTNSGNYWPIESYLWIIKDYIENGVYYTREKQYSNQKNGKIDWKKTLRTTPIVSNGNVIYDNLITSKMIASNDIISHTYQVCLKKSIERIGWIFDFDIKIQIMPLYSVNEMIYFVKQELLKTYDDIKRMRFNNMINILESIDDKNLISSKFNYSINNYYYVFEQMIDKLFHGIEGNEKKKYNPSGYWKLLGHKPKLASNLRPDTIYKKDDKTYVLDAKMYQYGFTHNIEDLPDTSSMQKQITYGDFIINNVDPKTKVRNAFILPYDSSLEKFMSDKNILNVFNNDIIYIGEAYVDWRNTFNINDHERIFGFLIDFNYLLRNYNINSFNSITSLTDTIEKLLYKNEGDSNGN